MRPAILSSEWIGKIGMVKEIEKLGAELRSKALRKVPILGHRKIPVLEAGVAEDIATHRAFGSKGWRQHH